MHKCASATSHGALARVFVEAKNIAAGEHLIAPLYV